MPAVSVKQPNSAKPTTNSATDAIAKLQQRRTDLTEDIRTFIRRRVERDDLWKAEVLPWQRVDLIVDYAYELEGAETALKAALQDPGLAERDIRFVRLLTMQWSDATTRLEKLEDQTSRPAAVGQAATPDQPAAKSRPVPMSPFKPSVAPFIKPIPTARPSRVPSRIVPATTVPSDQTPKLAVPLKVLESRLSQGLQTVWRTAEWWQPQVALEKRWSVLVDVILEPNAQHQEALLEALSAAGKTKVLATCDSLRQDLRELYAHPDFSKLSEKVDAQARQAVQVESTDWVAEFVPEADLDKLFTELEGLLDDEQKLKASEPRAKEIFTKIQNILSESREQLDDEYEFLGLTPLERQLVLFRISDYRRKYRSRMRHLRQDLRELHGHPSDTFFPEEADDLTQAKSAVPDELGAVTQPPSPLESATGPKKKSVGDTLERVLDYVAGGWGEVDAKQKQETKQLEALAQEHDQAEMSSEVIEAQPEPIAFVPEDSSVRLAGQTLPQVLEQAIKAHPERYGADMTGGELEQYLYCRTLALRLSATLGGAQYAFTPQAVGMVQVFPELKDSGDWKATLAISGKRSTLETLLKDGYLQQK